MVLGSNKRIGCIVQARMGSSRLPGKSLMSLAGKPVLLRVVESLRKCKTFNRIVVATTYKIKDEVIINFCNEHNIDCFAGSENNVLNRYYWCAKEQGFGVVVRITADCPLIDSKIVDDVVGLFFESDIDYASNTLKRSFPRGLDVEVFSFDCLTKAFKEAVSDYDLEHVTPFIYNHPKEFRLKNLYCSNPNPEKRVCVDSLEDFKNVEKIIKQERVCSLMKQNESVSVVDLERSPFQVINGVAFSNHFSSGACFVVAEAGSNFVVSDDREENSEQCFRLVDAAVKAKVDCVKFQYWNAKELYRNVLELPNWKDYIPFELPLSWLKNLGEYCKEKEILLGCSAFSKKGFDEVEPLVDVLKVASVSVNDFSLLEFLALKKNPVIVSSGCSSVEQVAKVVGLFEDSNNSEFGLLHCVSKYPVSIEESCLERFLQFQKLFKVPVGISDHSSEPFAVPLFCLGAGARIIEKHFYSSKNTKSPDKPFSISSSELKELICLIRKLEGGKQ